MTLPAIWRVLASLSHQNEGHLGSSACSSDGEDGKFVCHIADTNGYAILPTKCG